MTTQKDDDDDARYRNRFRDGPNDEPMARHQKKVFNRATGEFQKPAIRMDKSPPKKGSGVLAKARKKVIDSNIEKGEGSGSGY